VGKASRGALCDEYFGAGLSEGNGGALIDSLIAAHEIGHNFGAQHDGEPGTSCPDATGDYIMSASVNGSQQFSNCSIAIMQVEAAAAACVVALPAVDVSIEPDVDFSLLLLGIPADLEYRVSSNGTLEAANVQADFVLPTNLSLDGIAASAGSCSGGAGLASCSLGTLAGLGDETVTISVTPVAVGSGAAIATISTSGDDERAGNNQDVSNYTIQAPVDLVARLPVAPDVMVDASTTIMANVDNISSIDATSVTASIVLENGIRAVSANWSIGSCTVTAQQVSCQANSLAAMSSSTLTIAVNATLRGRRDVTVTLGSAEPDATPQDNTIIGEVVVVVERRNDDDGGGSTSPLLLLFGLGSVFLVRRRQVTGLGKIAD
jgi:MYXO-CTERM domain-containing protein